MTLIGLLLVFILAWYVNVAWVFYIWWGLAFVLALGKYAVSYTGGKKNENPGV